MKIYHKIFYQRNKNGSFFLVVEPDFIEVFLRFLQVLIYIFNDIGIDSSRPAMNRASDFISCIPENENVLH